MKTVLWAFLFILSAATHSQDSAEYRVSSGSLHRSGKVQVTVLPEIETFKVKMEYQVRKKDLVPVPSSLLRGEKVFEFPAEFRTEVGYKELEKKGEMDIPKARLKFVKREDLGEMKGAYFIEVHPTNKKSRIDITYHPQLPSVGWNSIKITFISPFPILDGYQLKAELKR